MKKYIFIILLITFSSVGKAQVFSSEDLDTVNVYNNLLAALKNPQSIFALDLSKQKMTEFPREIFKLTNLNILILKKNKLVEIPDSIFVLKNLQELDLSKNKLTDINDSIFGLKHLKKLELSENKISVISYKLSYLNQLEELSLWGLPIIKVPQEIYDLPELNFLDVRQIYFTPKVRAYIVDNLPNAQVKISNVCDCGN